MRITLHEILDIIENFTKRIIHSPIIERIIQSPYLLIEIILMFIIISKVVQIIKNLKFKIRYKKQLKTRNNKDCKNNN